MKFTNTLPLAALIAATSAQDVCSDATTRYVTVHETETVTVQPAISTPVAASAAEVSPSVETCGLTFTETVKERITVTVPAPGFILSSTPAAVIETVYATVFSSTTVDLSPSGTEAAPVESSSVPESSAYAVSAASFPPVSSYEAFTSYASYPSSITIISTPATTPTSAPSTTSTAAVATSSAAPSSGTTTPGNTSLGGESYSGEATFYGGNVSGGMCSFSDYTLPSSLFGTALSDSNWEDAGNCGACVSVTRASTGESITAMIVDQCPGCGTNHLDLFENGFLQLGTASEGIIDVTWEIVECGISTPLKLKNKEGTSAYWFSMQVVNANVPVTKLEVSTDGGSSWQETTRSEYNFFENDSGYGTDAVSVRVTSSTGKTVVVHDVSVSSGTEVDASSNF